ncbi:hypothetical protein RS1P1_07440 [Pseudomonas moraviensis]|nr:hypothetical protein RS1P1_07440 [Pseudomonas moraviensis]
MPISHSKPRPIKPALVLEPFNPPFHPVRPSRAGPAQTKAQREFDQHREQNPGAGVAIEPLAKTQRRQTETADNETN